jgi:molybdate transport system substrate-binding protein
LGLSACAREPFTLTIMAAASLTEAFQELAAQFEAQNPGVSVSFNFAGSQQLAQQLAEGAPADVFASANQKQMEAAVDAGRIDENAVVSFARNRLVVIFPKGNPAGLNRLEDLARPGLKLVLAAKEVPIGQYSLDFLEKAGQESAFGLSFPQRVLKNVVSYEENVKSVLNKVILGEADAGIVYTSDVSRETASKVEQLTIPDELNVIASYPIAVIKNSQNAAQAQDFVELVLSPAGQEILAKYGFVRVAK